jgi:PKD repeat protein
LVVNQLPVPVVNLGPDVFICDGSSQTLTGPAGMAGYSWSNGVITQQNTVSLPGSYQLTVTGSNGCIGFDEVLVSLFPAANLNLGPDSVLCPGDSLSLTVGSGYTNPLWSTGATGSSITVGQGTYFVNATDANGCTASDTVVISAGPAVPVAQFMAVQLGDSVALTFTGSGTVDNLLWDFGDGITSTVANPTHQFANPGNYTVCLTVSNVCGADTLCQSFVVVGMEMEVEDGTVEVFPNPTGGEFAIRLEFATMAETQIEVYNAMGQLVAEWKPGSVANWEARCNASLWSAGVYAVRVQRGSTALTNPGSAALTSPGSAALTNRGSAQLTHGGFRPGGLTNGGSATLTSGGSTGFTRQRVWVMRLRVLD